LGIEINEKKSVRVQPKEAYGPVDPNAFKEVPKSEIPAELLQVGTMLHARGPRGEEFSVRRRKGVQSASLRKWRAGRCVVT
jgi:peptidylprolyl isomerase